MADTKSNQPPPGYPVQNYPNRQPPPGYVNGLGGQPFPQPPGYGNAQPQYQTPQLTGQPQYQTPQLTIQGQYGNAQPQYQTPQVTGQGQYVPVQGSYPPQVPPPGQYYYPQQQPQIQPIFIPVPQPPVIYTQPMMAMGGQCNPGHHIFRVQYGACGIIAAIVLFPIGLLFLFVDQERRCMRCGMTA